MRATEVAYRRLRDDIIAWRLEPGTPLGEVETAERIGVSRTPVREALEMQAARLAAKRRDAEVFESLRAEFLEEPTPTTSAPPDDQRTYALADALDSAIDDAAAKSVPPGGAARRPSMCSSSTRFSRKTRTSPLSQPPCTCTTVS